jgi:serine/threonine-protein kinase
VSAEPATSLIGLTLGGRFLIRYPIASGGMGAVYEAEDTLLGRAVALKVVRADLLPDPRTKERFRREALATAAVTHPALVTLFDLSLDTTPPFLVMELIDGTTVDELLAREGRVAWPRAVRWTLDVLDALDVLHRAGVIHRDIKPNNLMVVGQGESERCRVIDLGVARLLGPAHAELTATGVAVGTPAFMAPEQLAGESVGPAADLWSLGVVLFKALTGFHPSATALPQTGASPAESLSQLSPELPTPLVEIVAGLLQRDPARRPQAARGVMNPLRTLLRLPGVEPHLAQGVGVGLESTPGASNASVPLATRALPTGLNATPNRTRILLALLAAALVGSLGFAAWVTMSSEANVERAAPPTSAPEAPRITPQSAEAPSIAVGVDPPPSLPADPTRTAHRPSVRERSAHAPPPEPMLAPLPSSPGHRPGSRLTVTLLGAFSDVDTAALGETMQRAVERCVDASRHYAGEVVLSMYVTLTQEGSPSAFHPMASTASARELSCVEALIRRTRWPAASRARTTTIRILTLR